MITTRPAPTLFAPTLFGAALFATLAAAAPASADPVKEVAKPAVASSPIAGDTRRYCVGRTPTGETTVTGSMLSRKTCRTREAWAARGVTIKVD